MTLMNDLTRVVREGLASHLSLSVNKIKRVNNDQPPGKPPYILYELFEVRRHPGMPLGFNPMTPACTEEIPDETGNALVTGTVSHVSPRLLIDEDEDFEAAGIGEFFYVKNLDTEAETKTLRRNNKNELLLNKNIFTIEGENYEVRRFLVRKTYDRPQHQGLSLDFFHTSPTAVDAMADEALKWFQLKTLADKALLPYDFRVFDPGGITNIDIVAEDQKQVFVRNLTVTLRGNELLTEDVEGISTVDLEVDGEHATPPKEIELLSIDSYSDLP